MAKEGGVEELTAKMIRREENQREALISAMREKFNARTVFESEGQELQDRKDDIFATLSGELSQRPMHYAQTLHYSNIVSAYTVLRKGDKEIGQNTAALAAELEHSAYDTQGQGHFKALANASGDNTYIEGLQDSYKDLLGRSPSSQDNELKEISIESINAILNFLPRRQ